MIPTNYLIYTLVLVFCYKNTENRLFGASIDQKRGIGTKYSSQFRFHVVDIFRRSQCDDYGKEAEIRILKKSTLEIRFSADFHQTNLSLYEAHLTPLQSEKIKAVKNEEKKGVFVTNTTV